MNPFKSNNIVAKVLQVYAYLNAAAGFVLTLLLNEELDLGAVEVSIILATVLVVNFFIFALGEVIDLLQNLKDNTSKKAEIPDELPDPAGQHGGAGLRRPVHRREPPVSPHERDQADVPQRLLRHRRDEIRERFSFLNNK